MTEPGRKRCVVAYATRGQQRLWTVELPQQATIAEALEVARRIAGEPTEGVGEIPWDTAPVGIFGELRDRASQPADGDRIELYRPLHSDPRERRRERVQRSRKMRGR